MRLLFLLLLSSIIIIIVEKIVFDCILPVLLAHLI
jgi:hypothetical protein